MNGTYKKLILGAGFSMVASSSLIATPIDQDVSIEIGVEDVLEPAKDTKKAETLAGIFDSGCVNNGSCGREV